MAYLLQFCGVSDPLQLFHLEQSSLAMDGPAFAGFRPFQLDDLLGWALEAARQRSWDLDLIQRTVLDGWLERAEAIHSVAAAPARGALRSAAGGWPRHPARLGAPLRGPAQGLSSCHSSAVASGTVRLSMP